MHRERIRRMDRFMDEKDPWTGTAPHQTEALTASLFSWSLKKGVLGREITLEDRSDKQSPVLPSSNQRLHVVGVCFQAPMQM